MIGSYNCLITGVRLQPTVRLFCSNTTEQIEQTLIDQNFRPMSIVKIRLHQTSPEIGLKILANSLLILGQL